MSRVMPSNLIQVRPRWADGGGGARDGHLVGGGPPRDRRRHHGALLQPLEGVPRGACRHARRDQVIQAAAIAGVGGGGLCT